MAKKPRRRYQDRDAPIRRIAVAGAFQARASMKQALRALPAMLDMDKARELIRHGRGRDIAHTAIDWHHFQQVLRHPFERLARAYEAGAELGQRKINGAFAARRRGVRYRKEGGPGAVVMRHMFREEPSQEATGGPGAELAVSEALQLLNRESSVAKWADRPGEKFDKATVDYTPGLSGSMCRDCLHYRAPACEQVTGDIDPDYWCELFAGVSKAYDPDQERDEHGRWTGGGVSEAHVVLSDRSKALGEKLMGVDAKAIDAAWKQDPSFHVGPGGEGPTASPGKYESATRHISSGKKTNAPELGVQENGRVGFADGRHRFAAMRDRGIRVIPVAMDRESIRNARKYGYLRPLK
jgi:hypothetical protein